MITVGYPGFERYFFEQELDDLDESLRGGGWDIIVDGYRYYFDFDGMDYHGQMADMRLTWETENKEKTGLKLTEYSLSIRKGAIFYI